MTISRIIKSILDSGDLNQETAVLAVIDSADLTLYDFKQLMGIIRHYSIPFEDKLLLRIFMVGNDDVRYAMWKEGLVDFAPISQIFNNDSSLPDAKNLKLLDKWHDVVIPNVEGFFTGIEAVILKCIRNATDSIDIAMAWFTNPRIFNALMKKIEEDVSVRILINNDRINNNPNALPFNRLIKAGAELYLAETPDFIHHKFCLIDGNVIINGSYNWTVLAELANKENIVVIKNDSNLYTLFEQEFEELLRSYASVDTMPSYVPERPQYDSCSYSFYQSHELVTRANNVSSQRAQRRLFKEALRISSNDTVREAVPSDWVDKLQKEIEFEKNKIERLQADDLARVQESIQKALSQQEKKIERVQKQTQSIAQQKERQKRRYQENIRRIARTTHNPDKAAEETQAIKVEYQRERNRQNRLLNKLNNELGRLETQRDVIQEELAHSHDIENNEVQGNIGKLRINLRWSSHDDLDLHLRLPDSREVFYHNKDIIYHGCHCILDLDANCSDDNLVDHPQENIYWENEIPTGIFSCFVVLYCKRSSKNVIPFTVSILTGDGKIATKTYSFVNEKDGAKIDIADLIYNESGLKPVEFK